MDGGKDDIVTQEVHESVLERSRRPVEPDVKRVVNGPVSALGRMTPPARLGMVNGDGSARLDGVVETAGWVCQHQDPTSHEDYLLATNAPDHLSIPSTHASMSSSSGKSDNDMDVDLPPDPSPETLTNGRTGLCYDVRMRFHCEIQPERDDYHPEDPRRTSSIFKLLCLAGLVDDVLAVLRPLVEKPLLRVEARKADISEICMVHDRRHYDFVESTKDMTEDQLMEISQQWDSIYFNTQTFLAASLSAGGVIECCRSVASGQLKNAIAVVRPPGHHAECNRSMGFCFFDNVSIAAKVCQVDFGESCRKILIVDWDVHHGNGIQQAFWEDPNVLYISIHVHKDGEFYPPGQYGDHLHCGQGNGLGKNINIPWPMQGMGDADYLYAFQQIIMPVAFEFGPDLVIVAAGFDAAAGDQLGLCFVSPACYAHMTYMLMSLAGGKVVCCLEGGYNLDAIASSALAVTRTLMGEPPDRIVAKSPTKSAVATVQKVALVQSEYWHCLRPKNVGKTFSQMRGAERMHDVIRAYQAQQMLENHKMITLMVYHDKLTRSFDKEIIATSTYRDRVPLIVIFHDPPEIHGIIDPETQKLSLHNLYLTDATKNYIKWAVDHKFSVIDVNVPRHVTQDEDGYQEEAPLARAEAAAGLSIYLWENYIEPYHATEVFFFGFGTCYQAPLYLLSARESFRKRVTALISIVPHDLVPINDASIDRLAKWYYQNSLVILPHSHSVFDPERMKRPSKRFGKLVRSDEEELQEMLVKEMGRVWEFVGGRIGM